MSRTDAPVLEPKTEETPALAPPWRVILHDDDVTTQEFVVWLLITLFGRSYEDAHRLMLEVHNGGAATVATCSQERAELYVEQIVALARPRHFPLCATAEPVL